jgi:predicted O-methyltransferase YrrM
MMSFPSFDEWCATLHPEDTHPWNFRTQEFYNEYRTKYAIAKLVKPKSILEIGVRFGYSARAFLCAGDVDIYIGLDFDEPSWGSYAGVPREWAQEQLRIVFPSVNIVTYNINTQTDGFKFGGKRFDLVHIDADHSYQGALNDMQKFWPLTERVMVVDDFVEVQDAVETFISTQLGIMLSVTSLRSSALIVRGQ